jgi:hypothetical protein
MDNFFSDEEEFTPQQQVPEQAVVSEEFDFQNPVFLYRMFYNKLFPWKVYFHWLNFDTSKEYNTDTRF